MFDFIKNRFFAGRRQLQEHHIALTFHSLKDDISLLKAWISHLHTRNRHLERSHEALTLTKEEVKNLTAWAHSMEQRHAELGGYLRNTHEYLLSLHQRHQELADRLSSVEHTQKGQVGTTDGTSTGQVKDKSLAKIPAAKPLIDAQQGAIRMDTLSGAQIEVLNLLYNYDKPLGYDAIAKYLGKKEKSIRNLIYELREQGITIRAKPIGVRKKGFFVDAEEKIRVSGR
ncbi:hypothetical protein HY491_00305 [Candidatus Woesearchaeota archaeon]|nr:hypothetical protein [Candidatus Woesearchaeota archaeon]